MISSGLANKVELGTLLGTQDLYDLLEIISVDRHNEWLVNQDSETS